VREKGERKKPQDGHRAATKKKKETTAAKYNVRIFYAGGHK